jgi:hypothetical protein
VIIQSSELSMRSASVRQTRRETQTTVRVWRDPAPTRPAHEAKPPVAEPDSAVEEEAGQHPWLGRLASLIALVERMTGERVEVIDPAELAGQVPGHAHGGQVLTGGTDGRHLDAPPRRGWGMEAESTDTTVDREGTAVEIDGVVTTADGRRIAVDVDLELYRETVRQTRVSVAAGDPKPKDPLALSFGVTPSLSTARAEVDLDGDGLTESVPFVGDGMAYLVLDRNGDGTVNDGTELFGPASGDGFADLRRHDADGNGWIDEADPVFTSLRLWGSPQAGLQTLAEHGVGAIGLTGVSSPYRLQADGQMLGELRSTGIWLAEDGSVGTVHQVDVVT